MSLFVSKRERRLWYWTIAASVAIFSGIWLSGSLAEFLRDRGWLTTAFWIAMMLVMLSIIIYGIKTRPSGMEVVIWVGLAAIYLMVALRIYAPEERSHLIEYSVLALFILETLRERRKHIGVPKYAAWAALGLTTAIGILDEVVQFFVPERVFDLIDIAFDFLAATMAIVGSVILEWARSKIQNFLDSQKKQ